MKTNTFIDKYHPNNIDKLQRILQGRGTVEKPQDFAVEVDDIRIVNRTSNFEYFNRIAEFVDGTTQFVTVMAYRGKAQNHDRHIFKVGDAEPKNQNTLSGPPEQGFDERIEKALQRKELQWNFDLLNKEKGDLISELEDANKYIKELESGLEQLKDRKWYSGDVNVAELLSVVAEGMIRRNPQWVSALPMGESLAGVITKESEPDQNATSEAPAESTATFSRSSDTSTPDDKAESLIKGLQLSFDDSYIPTVIKILGLLANEPSNITQVLDLLKS